SSEPGKSRYRLLLPGAHLPIAAIELQLTNADVFRDASVTESRLTGSELTPAPIGSATLRRATRDGAIAEQLAIPISFPQGSELELAVNDSSNPPLNISGVMARLAPLPAIYF